MDLAIEKKERVVLIGPSDSGKSTLLCCLNALEELTKGEILFHNQLLCAHNKREIQKKIGMVFQSFHLFSNMTVLENLTFAPIRTKLLSKEEAGKKVFLYLKKISLEEKKDYKHFFLK